MKLIRFFLIVAFLLICITTVAPAQQTDSYRISQLEQHMSKLDHDVKDAGDTGLVLILFGAFCALWAQNTGRSAWLWFFLGVFFSIITIFFLLTKNSNDNFGKRKGAQS
jgi:hypothetical protein